MSDIATLRAIHAALTLETLEALANKGLVRRAQKDLERGEVKAEHEDGKALAFTVSGNRVQLIEAGPAKASCSCPAAGVCQHIIAACLSVMQGASETPSVAVSPRQEWLSPADEEVIKHFGLPTLRAAHDLLADQAPEIEDGPTFIVRFPMTNAEARGVSGAGLAGIIVSGAAEKHHALISAAAVLQVRRLAGNTWEPAPSKGESAVAPVSRDDVLHAASALLMECIATGLARLSESSAQRFESLSVSAQGAALPRLASLSQRIATQMDDWLARRPHADLGRLLADLSLCHALTWALKKEAKPHLIGTARESYADVTSLDLVCLAGWPWRTASGYEGLTLLFWDKNGRQWNTWTDARPKSFLGGFNAAARWTQPGPWEGAESPASLTGQALRLMKARRNRWGRLSSSAQTRALVTGTAAWSELGIEAVEDWQPIESSLLNTSAIGLRERDPRAVIHLIKPAAWDRHPFDPVTQTLSWLLMDTNGRSLLLRVPFDELSKPVISALESLTSDVLNDAQLLVRCARVEDRIAAYPLALITAQGIKSVAFEKTQPSKPPPLPKPRAPSDDSEDDEADEDTDSTPANTATTRWANALISSLEWIAESGTRSPGNSLSSDHALGAKHLGLVKLEALTTSAQPLDAERLLRLRWIAGQLL